MMRGGWMRLVPLAALVLALAPAGCGEAEKEPEFARRATTVAEVPANVMDVAKKELPGVEFTDAWKNVDRDGKFHSYEIRGHTTNGKIREVRVSPEGKVLEKE
jgi:hypothetical protein